MKSLVQRMRWVWLVLLLGLGMPMVGAQGVAGQFLLVNATGKVTVTLLGRPVNIKPGDPIPTGAAIRTETGSSAVVSPAQGEMVAVTGGSQVLMTSDKLSLSGGEPNNQVAMEVLNGSISVDTGGFQSPLSKISVVTKQGVFSANIAAFTVTQVMQNNDPSQIVGGVQVTHGKVEGELSTGEVVGITAGQYLEAKGVGNDLERVVSDGTLPSLMQFDPNESIISEGEVQGIGNSPFDEKVAEQMAEATVPLIQQDLQQIEETDLSLGPPPQTLPTEGQGSTPTAASSIREAMNNSALSDQILRIYPTSPALLAFAYDGTLDDGIAPPVVELIDEIEGSTYPLNPADPFLPPGSGSSRPIDVVLLPPQLTSPNLGQGAVGVNFSYGFTSNEANTAYSISGTLPPGLSFAGTIISGIPTAVGTYTINVTASSPDGTSITPIEIEIFPIPVVTITPNFSGTVSSGQTISYTVSVASTAPEGVSITVTGLPSFLTFDGVSKISGTIPASAAGQSYSFLASATINTLGGTGSTSATLVVAAASSPTGGPTITNKALPSPNSLNYVDPASGVANSSIFNAVSGVYPYWGVNGNSLVDGTVTSGNPLYWPWSDPTLGPVLISLGWRPSGDVFAAYYVYTHYAASGTGASGTGLTTAGTYTGTGSTFSYDGNIVITP